MEKILLTEDKNKLALTGIRFMKIWTLPLDSGVPDVPVFMSPEQHKSENLGPEVRYGGRWAKFSP